MMNELKMKQIKFCLFFFYFIKLGVFIQVILYECYGDCGMCFCEFFYGDNYIVICLGFIVISGENILQICGKLFEILK